MHADKGSPPNQPGRSRKQDTGPIPTGGELLYTQSAFSLHESDLLAGFCRLSKTSWRVKCFTSTLKPRSRVMTHTTCSLFGAPSLARIFATACMFFTCASCSKTTPPSSLTDVSHQTETAIPVIANPAATQAEANTNEETSKSFAAWFTEGATALQDGDNETAVTAYTKAIELDPKSAETLNARGVAFLRMHRISLALSDFNAAIILSPRVPKYHGNRALVYADKADHSRAVADLTSAIELDPKAPEWLRQRSDLYQMQGNDALSKADVLAAELLENPSLAYNPSGSATEPSEVPSKPDPLANTRSTVDLSKYQVVHELLEDIHEFTRLKLSSATELRFLLDDMQRELESLYADQSAGTHDPVYNAYFAAFELHDDACRVWDVYAKTHNLLDDAKARWRQRIDPSALVDEISSFEFIIERGHIPNTLFPSTSRLTTGLTDIVQRHPEIAGEFNGYSFVMQHSIAYLLKRSELLTSLLFPGKEIEEAPPYGLLDIAPTQRLATRLQAHQITTIVGDAADSPLFKDTERLRTIFKDWATRRADILQKAERIQGARRDQFIQNGDKGLMKLLTGKYKISHMELDKIQELGAAQNWW